MKIKFIREARKLGNPDFDQIYTHVGGVNK